MPKKPGSWDEFFLLADASDIPADFMAGRANGPTQERHLVAEDEQTDDE